MTDTEKLDTTVGVRLTSTSKDKLNAIAERRRQRPSTLLTEVVTDWITQNWEGEAVINSASPVDTEALEQLILETYRQKISPEINSEISSAIAHLETKHKNLEINQAELREAITPLPATVTNLTNSLSAVIAYSHKINAKLSEVESEIQLVLSAPMEGAIASIQDTVSTLGDSLEAVMSDVHNVNTKISTLASQESLISLNQRVEDLNESTRLALSLADAQIDELQNRVIQVEGVGESPEPEPEAIEVPSVSAMPVLPEVIEVTASPVEDDVTSSPESNEFPINPNASELARWFPVAASTISRKKKVGELEAWCRERGTATTKGIWRRIPGSNGDGDRYERIPE